MTNAPFVDLDVHHKPAGFSDHFAFGFTKLLRFCADTFFAKRYGHRAVVLETVAAVPGMVGATINHLKCLFERLVIIGVQWIFYVAFFLLYLISAKTAHRVVGYFEEEAVISYTHYLAEIDEGRSANVPAPAIAMRYWKMPAGSTLRDVVLLVRADEAHHRDVNHGFSNELKGVQPATGAIAPYPEHALEIAQFTRKEAA